VENFADDDSISVHQSRSSATIDKLQEFIKYNITVQGLYRGGLGPANIPLRVQTWSTG